MSEKKVGKRLLTWVLVLVMTLSLLPLNVLADEIPLDEPTGEEAMIDERDNVMDVSLDGIAERKSSQNYATWWPVFWGFDKKSEVTTANLIKVTAGTGNTVLYASEQLSAKEALQAQTATVGNAVNNNFQVVADPGYYVSQYRIVCGNHYGCGVSPYNSSTPVNTDGNYTSAITVLAPAEKFTHNKINGIFSKYPQQAPDPNDEDLYDFSLLGANQYYPYYLLIEVKQDTARYQAEYKWGELNGKLTEKVPASHTDLLRNSEFTAQAPSEAALEAARSLGYKFHGWKISGTGYTDNDQVSSGNAVTIRGGNLELIAQWKKTPFTVTYEYTGTVPAGAPAVPASSQHTCDESVTVAAVSAPNGYRFTGWVADDIVIDNDTFTMPARDVKFTGSFVKDDTQWYSVKYTWADAPEGVTLPTDTETYLGVAAAKAAVDKKYTNGYQFSGSDGYFYTFSGWNEGTVNGQVVTFTGSWTKGDKDNSQWYTVKYTWADAPEGVTLPTDTETYLGVAAAKAAVDKKYTNGYQFSGSDGYFYTFSGWNEGTVNGQVVTFNGSWTKGDKDNSQWYTVKYTWADAPEGVTLPTDTETYLGVAAAKAAVDKKYTNGYQFSGSDGYFYTFSGWNEGTVNGQVVTFTGSWTKGDKDNSQWYTVKYTWADAPEGVTLPTDTETYLGVAAAKAAVDKKYTNGYHFSGSDGYFYTFSGWNEGTVNGQVVTFNGSWTKGDKDPSKWATVTFNSNGGSAVASQTVKSSATATKPTNPTRSGYTFAGWYTDNEKFTTKYDFATPVTKNITLYAKWNTNYVPYYPPVPPTVKIEDDDALGLNTTDHFAYIVGYGNGEVRPQNNITRAEVATIFFRLLTDDVRDENLTKTNRYSDVAATAWYNTAVSTLSSMGIITGYPDGTFRPNAAITRAEFAAIAARFDNNGDKAAAKFSDIANHWAKDEISIAYNNGWITGYPNGTFGPQRDITRAETMTLVNRVLNRQPETEDDLLPNMTVWTDNANPKAWYYLAVQEATNSHYYKFKTNSKYEKWTELRETRDWTQLEK